MKKTFKLAINIFVLSISFFVLSQMNAFAEEHEVRNPENNELLMTYDDATKEVVVSDSLNNDQKGIDNVLCLYEHESIVKKDSFPDKYGFVPKKITCNGVTYELRTHTEGCDAILTITSIGGNKICRSCIVAFDVFDRQLFGAKGPYAKAKTNIQKVIIKGENFTQIPDKCFYKMGGLHTLDIKDTNIKTMKSFGKQSLCGKIGGSGHVSTMEVPADFSIGLVDSGYFGYAEVFYEGNISQHKKWVSNYNDIYGNFHDILNNEINALKASPASSLYESLMPGSVRETVAEGCGMGCCNII